jgi:hypothetical protein
VRATTTLFAVYLGVECTDAQWPTNWNVLIDETLDAATPFTGSLEVRKLFPHAVLVAEPGGTTHAETPTGEDPCVDDTIGNYLATGLLPPRNNHAEWDKTCPPPPTPVPQPASASVARGSARAPRLRSHVAGPSVRTLTRFGLPAVELR